MDTLSMRFGIVQRSAGGDARKMAAYQMCAKLRADGRRLDFTRKAKEHRGRLMLMPVDAPAWAHDPQKLWDRAEAAERRGDAQSARLLEFSIPRAVPEADRLDFVRHVLTGFVDQGMGVQADLHSKIANDGEEHPHAHVMLTLRKFDGEAFAAKKNREWNNKFRDGKGKAVREKIADRMNEFLAQRGIAFRVDHRSFADRGIERESEENVPRRSVKAHEADPDSPEAKPMRDVLDARAERAELAAAEALEAKASAAIAALAAEITRRQETQIMPTTPTRRAAAGTRTEPWMRFQGGLDALAEAHQKSARISYERWTNGRPEIAAKHDLADYVTYVQDRHAERAADHEAESDEQEKTKHASIAPASYADAVSRRRRHLEALLAGHYREPETLAPYVQKIDVDHEARTATLHLKRGGRLIDYGDHIEHRGTLTPESAAAIAAAAAAHGWERAHITGNAQFRDAIAEALALHEPPVPCDHTMSKAAQERVATKLRERAAAAVPAIDGRAVRLAAASDPAQAARIALDYTEARARAALAGRPTGSTDAQAIAEPRVAEAISRRTTAAADAREAVQAAAAHREAHPWTARILDGASRRRQAALDAEAIRLDREARVLDRGHEHTVKRIEKEAYREAKANRGATEDWKWSTPVRTAEAQLARIERVRSAVAQGDPDAISAAAKGDITGAEHGVIQRQQERQEEERQARQAEQQREREAARQAAAAQVLAIQERATAARIRPQQPTPAPGPGPGPGFRM